MELIETQPDGLGRTYRVTVSKADLQAALAAKIEEVRPQVRINGFRPGKVPVAHIRKVYGASMMKDVVDATLQKRAQDSLAEVNVRVAAEPRFDLESDMNRVIAGEADLAFIIKVELMPEFEPIDVSTVAIRKITAEVPHDQIDEALENIAKSSRSFSEKDGAAETGDQLVIDFLGKIDGEAFDGGAAEDATVEIGANRFIPGFEEQLVGAKPGEERVLNVTFPAEYPVPSLAGKDAAFDVKVKAVKGPQDQPIDDTLAKNLGLEDLNALRKAVKERLNQDYIAQARIRAKRILFDRLDEAHSFALPSGMVQAEFDQIWRQITADQDAGRLDADDAAKTDEALRADYMKIAERRVRLGLVLAEIGRRNNVELRQEEVNEALLQEVRRYPGREQQVYDMYVKTPQLMAQLRAPIYEEKVVDFIFELAKVETVVVSREELFAEDED
jgi:trigger factor